MKKHTRKGSKGPGYFIFLFFFWGGGGGVLHFDLWQIFARILNQWQKTQALPNSAPARKQPIQILPTPFSYAYVKIV